MIIFLLAAAHAQDATPCTLDEAYPIAGTALFASAVTTLSDAPLVIAPVSAPMRIARLSFRNLLPTR